MTYSVYSVVDTANGPGQHIRPRFAFRPGIGVRGFQNPKGNTLSRLIF